MTTPTIAQYKTFADLQMAAEALYDFRAKPPANAASLIPGDPYSGAINPLWLTEGNLHASKFTATDATKFIQEWTVVQHKSNTATGFSGTLFENNTTHQLVMSFRSTEFLDDAARDNQATNVMEVKEHGWAFGQIADMEAWYQTLLAGPLAGGKHYAVTGYSLGGHLATAFNLLRWEDGTIGNVDQVVTFNGAGVGNLRNRTTDNLTAIVSDFNRLRQNANGTEIVFENAALTAAYATLRARIKDGTVPSSADYALIDAITAPVSATVAQVLQLDKDKNLIRAAMGRILDLQVEITRLAGIRDQADGQLAAIPGSQIEQMNLDYQVAVQIVAERTQAMSLPRGVLNTFSGRSQDAPFLANQYDVVGQTTPFSPSMVANSQWHHGTEVGVFIEDQPQARGTVIWDSLKQSWIYKDPKLLVNDYTRNDFGDTHSLVLIVDSLKAQELLSRLAPATSLADMQTLFAAASSLRAKLGFGTQGTAEGDVAEVIVNALADQFLGRGTPSTWNRLNGDPLGNTWASTSDQNGYTGREAYATLVQEIGGKIDASGLAGKIALSLAGRGLKDYARDDFGAFLALYTLSPFVLGDGQHGALIATALGQNGPWRDTLALWQADRTLGGADRASGKATFSDQWLADRGAVMDVWQQANENNDTVTHADGSRTTQVIVNGLPGTDEWRYIDGVSGQIIQVGSDFTVTAAPPPAPKIQHIIDFGTDNNETLAGGDGASSLYGMGGNDTLSGQGAADHLEGGDGNDTLNGAGGADSLFGGAGKDTLDGGADSDILDGGAGEDTLKGDTGADRLNGNDGDDILSGGTGADQLIGGQGSDTYRFATGDGDDTITDWSGDAHDGDGLGKIEFDGQDLTRAYDLKANSNSQWGDTNWTLEYTGIPGGRGLLTIGKVGGTDHLLIPNFQSGDLGIVLKPGTPPAPTSTYQPDQVAYTHWGGGDTRIIGNGYDNTLQDLGQGANILEGRDGFDNLYGGVGNDRLYADREVTVAAAIAAADVPATAAASAEALGGGSGDDLLVGAAGGNYQLGGGGGDLIIGGGAHDVLLGDLFVEGAFQTPTTWTANFGWDQDKHKRYYYLEEKLAGGGSNYYPAYGDLSATGAGDTLIAGAGNDEVWGDLGDDTLELGAGDDWGIGGEDDDLIQGGAGDDLILGDIEYDASTPKGSEPKGELANYLGLAGEAHGRDTLYGGDGKDIIEGNGNDDQLDGGADDDELHGDDGVTPGQWQGNDLLIGGAGKDQLWGDGKDDRLDGGAGDDKLSGDNSWLDGQYQGKDVLDGGAGDDKLWGNGGDDTLRGGDGMDYLEGDYTPVAIAGNPDFLDGQYHGKDTMDGGAGADEMIGGGGDDLMLGGDGDDVMSGDEAGNAPLDSQYHGKDTMDGGAGTDVLRGNGGDDRLYGGEGVDSLWGEAGNDLLQGDAGSDSLMGGAGDDTLRGGADGDLLKGGDGKDLLIGDAGYDRLEGEAGDDIYEIAAGEAPMMGPNLIGEGIFDSGGKDTLRLDAAVVAAVESLDHKLAIYFGSDDCVAIDGGLEGSIENFEIGGETLGVEELIGRYGPAPIILPDRQMGGNVADSLTASTGGVAFSGGLGNDNITASGGNNTYRFNRGDGADIVTDTSHASGQAGANTLRLGTGIAASDLVLRRNGNNLLIQLPASGDQVTVTGHFAGNALDSIAFADGGSWDTAAMAAHLTNTLTEGNDDFTGTAGNDIIDALGGHDRVLGMGGDDTLTGGSGVDTLDGGDGNDTLLGGSGDDALWGGNGSDTYVFGPGDGADTVYEQSDPVATDTIRMGAGIRPGDVVVSRYYDTSLKLSVGSDTIVVASAYAGSDLRAAGIERVVFDNGTVWTDADIRLMVMKGTEGNDTLKGFESDDVIDGLAGNDTISGLAGNDRLAGGAGDDDLFGGDGDDVLAGGSGGDYLDGGPGNDTFRYGRGDHFSARIDQVFGDSTPGAFDVLEFDPDIAPGDVTRERVGDDLVLRFVQRDADGVVVGTQNDLYLNLHGIFAGSGTSAPLDEIRFSDGTIWRHADLLVAEVGTTEGDDTLIGLSGNDIIEGRAGNDIINGAEGDDVIVGGPGSDRLAGASGNDIYRFFPGDGHDIINHPSANVLIAGGPGTTLGSDTLEFGPGIATSDVRFYRDGIGSADDLLIVLNASGSDQIRVARYFAGASEFVLDRIRFFDGTTWDRAAIATRVLVSAANAMTGTAGNDTFLVDSTSDTIAEAANQGVDTVRSSVSWQLGDNLENLTLTGSNDINGYGNTLANTVIGNDGDNELSGAQDLLPDTLMGGQGNDTYYLEGTDTTVVELAGEGVDSIVIGRQAATLPANVENLRFENGHWGTGTGFGVVTIETFVMAGNELDNVIDARDAGDMGASIVVDGGPGADTLYGNAHCWFVLDDPNDKVILKPSLVGGQTAWGITVPWDWLLSEGYGGLRLTGNAISGTGNSSGNSVEGNDKDNVLSGLSGNDGIFGGAGNDHLLGGTGDDLLLGEAGIDIIEGGSGNDILHAGLPGSLDELYGGDGDDRLLWGHKLVGGAGNDSYGGSWYSGPDWDQYRHKIGDGLSAYVDSDTVIVEEPDGGIDTVTGVGTVTLAANVENLVISGTGIGNELNNDITGSAGNDVIDGRDGADVMAGLAGADTYYVDDPNDSIVEDAYGGAGDTVMASRSYSLGAYVENLVLTGTGNFDASGNDGNNELSGNAGANRMDGGAGNDVLTGGDGGDTYVFGRGCGNDTIVEAGNGGVDRLLLTSGILPADVTVSSYNGGIVLRIVGTDDGIAFGQGIEQVAFSDATTVWTWADLVGMTANQGQNHAPTLGYPLPDVSCTPNTDFFYSIASWQFADPDPGDTLTLSIATANGAAPPSWLSLAVDTINGYVTISGRPPAGFVGPIGLRVTATDQGGLSVSDTFDLAGARTITGTSANDTLTGGAGDDTLKGMAGNDTLNGLPGNDLLDGGAGADTMTGGIGDDTYVVDATGDRVIENVDEGQDLVKSGVSFVLPSAVENLTLTGAAAIDGTGNALGNVVIGNSGNNKLIGDAGSDSLDGGLGNDIMQGGNDNDTYVVDAVQDQVIENANEGLDWVYSSVTWTLGANLEYLTLTGTSAIDGMGNGLDNMIYGNGENNILDGGPGNDMMMGGGGYDTFFVDSIGDQVGGSGQVFSSATFALSADFVGNLTLTGTAAIDGTGSGWSNVLTGNAADNVLDGAMGADMLVGGLGDDTYVVDNTGDVVTENANQGIDAVRSTVDWTLGTNCENLTLVNNSLATLGYGNAANNVLVGNDRNNSVYGMDGNDMLDGRAGDDVLFGDQGDDTLEGGQGKDVLVGGAGDDTYIWRSGSGIDQVSDGGGGVDTIRVVGLAPGQVSLSRLADSYASYDLCLSANGGADQMSIHWQFNTDAQNGSLSKAERLVFDDGTVWDLTTMNYAPIQPMTPGVVTGSPGSDVFDLRVGVSSTAYGGGGNTDSGDDTYLWGSGAGYDAIQDYGSAVGNIDTIRISGLAAAQIGVSREVDNLGYYNLLLTANGGADQLRVLRQFDLNQPYAIERIVFEDGTFWDAAALVNLTSGKHAPAVVNPLADQVAVPNVAFGWSIPANTFSDADAGDTLTMSASLASGAPLPSWLTFDAESGTFSGTPAGSEVLSIRVVATDSANLAAADVFDISVGATTQTLTGTANADVLIGGAGDDTLNGLAGNDSLTGLAGNDSLDGGAGADRLAGGRGNDVYVVDDAGDVVTENANEGTDLIRTSITTTAPANIENVTLTGASPIDGTGNALNNVLTGNSAANVLDGAMGADTLVGGLGDDTYVVDNIGDVVGENSNQGSDLIRSSVTLTLAANVENLTLIGTAAIDGTGNLLNNILTGNAADNRLDGGIGADTMVGGAGNDSYVVDNGADLIVENTNSGYDDVYASASFALPANVESLTLTGTSAIDAVGNDLNNTLYGNSGDNMLDGGVGLDVLQGGVGNDTYVVDSPADRINELFNQGTDLVRSSISFSLEPCGYTENLTLTGTASINGLGNALDNVLMGNSGANTLDGGAGADTMKGGLGNDIYAVDSSADVVVENANEGVDRVRSQISYVIGDNVENLTLMGLAALSGTGNALDNVLIGNIAANALSGGAGNDTLRGDGGNDTVSGGSGNDVYEFHLGDGQDTVDNGDVLSAIDTVRFGPGIGDTDVRASRVNNDLLLTVLKPNLSGDQIRVSGHFAAGWTVDGQSMDRKIDRVEFANGVVWDQALIESRADPAANHPPVIGSVPPSMQARANSMFSYTVPQDTITDPDSGDSVTYGARMEDGSALPAWLAFDSATRSFSGTPSLTDVGTLQLLLRGTDSHGATVSVPVLLLIAPANRAPVLATAIADQAAEQGSAFSYTIPADAFADPDTGDTLAYSATLSGGGTLPSWLTFDAVTRKLGGTPLVLGTVSVQITVTDSGSLTVGDTFDVVVGAPSNRTLTGTANSDTLTAGWGDDVLYGLAGDDTLTGLAGNDTLDGGTGSDTLIGGFGDDIYVVDNIGDVVTENANEGTDLVRSNVTVALAANVENLTLVGSSVIDGAGNALNNLLTGNGSANTLDGGAGADTLIGGLGNDTYVLDNVADVVTENADEGTDLVQSGVTVTLATNVENLTLIGTAAINGTGNGLDNVLVGNGAANVLAGGAGNDTLDGGAGNDTMAGGAGNDTYVVDATGDVVTENANEGSDLVQSSITCTLGNNVENLTLTGTAAISGTGNTLDNIVTGNGVVNTLTGGAGNDRLDGGTGADKLLGGLGNDTYIVDNTGDVITENASEGTDLVQSSVVYTLASNIENLTLTGTSAINGTGNTLNNALIGNSAANTLNGGTGNDTMTGGAGNDTYVVDATGDVVTENANEGADLVQSSVTYTLGINVENLTLTGTAAINGTGSAADNVLTGNSAINTLTGGAGNDTLDGGTGADKLLGGLGDDTYLVDNTGDAVTENANEGTDIVKSSVTLTLGANLENLTLTGTTAINGTGNTLNNVLTGNSGNNTLTGNAGNDTLDGGAGTDTLVGGAGNDTYVLGRGHGADTVTENDSTAGNTDVASFLAGIGTDQIWFRHVGSNLEVSIIGTSDKLTLSNWYTGNAYHVEQFKTADNHLLLDTKVEALVQAMAAFAPPSAGQTTLPANYQTALAPVIAANWQ